MSLANKLGSSYEQAKDKIKLRKIQISVDDATIELKVRIPLKKEMEAITTKISTPDDDRVKALYEFYTAGLKKSIDEGGDDFLAALNAEKSVLKVLDDDIILDGMSMKQAATMGSMYQVKVEEFFHLLHSETGEPINESYEQISGEFSEIWIKAIVEEIEKAIKPDYKSAKKD